MIQDYQNSLVRTMAGLIFGLPDRKLDTGKVTGVSRILARLKMSDYMELSFAASNNNLEDVKAILTKLGVKRIKGFPVVEAKTVKSRNPMVVHAKRRRHGVEDPKQKEDQKDPWSRGAKHKDKQMKKIEEGILGLNNVPVVGRLRELAGIKTTEPVQVQEKMQKLRHIKELEDFDDIETFDDFEDTPDDLDAASDFDDSIDTDMNTDMNMDVDVPVSEPEDEIRPEFPSFSSTLPSTVAPMPAHSPAYNAIVSSLDSISNQLKDVKVSEYKEILGHLKQVHQSIRNLGFDYLQESRQKKD